MVHAPLTVSFLELGDGELDVFIFNRATGGSSSSFILLGHLEHDDDPHDHAVRDVTPPVRLEHLGWRIQTSTTHSTASWVLNERSLWSSAERRAPALLRFDPWRVVAPVDGPPSCCRHSETAKPWIFRSSGHARSFESVTSSTLFTSSSSVIAIMVDFVAAASAPSSARSLALTPASWR